MCISSPSDIRVIKINTPIFCSFYIFQNVYLMHCDIKKSMGFRAHNNTQFIQIISNIYLLLFILSIHSHLPSCDCTFHVHKRCFAAHCVGLLQTVKALTILTALLQGSSEFSRGDRQ